MHKKENIEGLRHLQPIHFAHSAAQQLKMKGLEDIKAKFNAGVQDKRKQNPGPQEIINI